MTNYEYITKNIDECIERAKAAENAGDIEIRDTWMRCAEKLRTRRASLTVEQAAARANV